MSLGRLGELALTVGPLATGLIGTAPSAMIPLAAVLFAMAFGPLAERHHSADRLKAQQPARTALDALAAGQAMAVVYRLTTPDVPPDVDLHGTVE
jgi:hypothetical protein